MQRHYSQKVNLEELTKQIVGFFETRKFEDLTALRIESGYQIVAGDSQTYKIKSSLRVDLQKTSEGFSVNLELSKETKKFNLPMTLATMFGGGYFLLRDLKSDEAWIKIQREFWDNISKMIDKAGSTTIIQ